MPIRPRTDPQNSVVTHTHKTVRRQFVDIHVPPAPGEDEEAFILRDQHGRSHLTLSPANFQLFIGCCAKALSDGTGGNITVTFS